MRILIVNAVCGVTGVGRIVAESAKELKQQGHEVKVAYNRRPLRMVDKKDTIRIGGSADMMMHGVKNRIADCQGLGSAEATRVFLRQAEIFNPELLWLHNLHGYYLNYVELFRWIKSRPQMKVRWTLHDCWAFTGHCAHFSAIGCDKWIDGCHNCPLLHSYPASFVKDSSRRNFLVKKESFTGAPNLTIQCPSEWMKERIEKSFLGDYPIEVVPNRIDPEVFKPTEGDFRRRYGLQNKKIALAVGTTWTDSKGIPDYIRLSALLPEDVKLVLVGVDRKLAKKLPASILCIPRTDSATELAAIYTAADVLVNASREESFGMPVLEAHACGTPAVVYRGTACEEVAKSCGGLAVDMNAEALKEGILQMLK